MIHDFYGLKNHTKRLPRSHHARNQIMFLDTDTGNYIYCNAYGLTLKNSDKQVLAYCYGGVPSKAYTKLRTWPNQEKLAQTSMAYEELTPEAQQQANKDIATWVNKRILPNQASYLRQQFNHRHKDLQINHWELDYQNNCYHYEVDISIRKLFSYKNNHNPIEDALKLHQCRCKEVGEVLLKRQPNDMVKIGPGWDNGYRIHSYWRRQELRAILKNHPEIRARINCRLSEYSKRYYKQTDALIRRHITAYVKTYWKFTKNGRMQHGMTPKKQYRDYLQNTVNWEVKHPGEINTEACNKLI